MEAFPLLPLMVIASLLIGWIGSKRTIGFWIPFIVSIFMTPFVGGFVLLFSKNKVQAAHEKQILNHEKNHQAVIDSMASISKLSQSGNNSSKSIVEELEGLNRLKEKNLISEKEFQKLRNKIIN